MSRGAAGNIRVVLVRPRRGGNVGSVARAMKNMGLSDLVLVAPRTPVGASAEHMAAHAGDVLRARRAVPDLRTALADTTLAIGTVGRELPPRRRAQTPRTLAPQILAAARQGPVALVFGPEDHGLANADLDQCQQLLSIPTADAYASLNLAQAVLICAYELHLARAEDVGRPTRAHPAPRRAARVAELEPASGAAREGLFAHLEEALRAVGFLSPENPKHIMRDLRALFGRAGLTKRDVKVWRGIARQISWAGARVGGERPARPVPTRGAADSGGGGKPPAASGGRSGSGSRGRAVSRDRRGPR